MITCKDTSSSSNRPLKSCQICLTGITSSEERHALELITNLGGKLSRHLTKDAYCLVVKRVGSAKYQAAIALNIPCIQLQWLSDCNNSKSFIPFDNYKVQPLTGLSFSVTGFEPDERLKIQQLITEHDGVNCSVMTKDNCTHLIAKTPSGEKYNAAKHWKNINIVTVQWLYECVEKNKWVLESPYLIHNEAKLKEIHKKSRDKAIQDKKISSM